MRTSLKVGLAVLLIGVLVIIFFLSQNDKTSIFYIRNSLPDPQSDEMLDLKSISIDEVENTFSKIENSLDYKFFNSSYSEGCSKGQHNYKVNVPYDNKCSFSITHFYGFNGDFETKAVELEKRIVDLGGEGISDIDLEEQGIEYIINDYWTPGKNKPSPLNPERDYLVSDLPSVWYVINPIRKGLAVVEGNGEEIVVVEYAEKRTDDVIGWGSSSEEEIFLIINEITETHDYVVIITISKVYFLN